MPIPAFLTGLPKELIVFIVSALPVIEVRGAIPLGLYFGINPLAVFIITLLGGVLPLVPIIIFLDLGTRFLQKNKSWDNFFRWIFIHTRARTKIIEDLELLGLTIFIAIPLPGSGVWTGAIAAYIFRIPWWKALICGLIGTAIACIVVMLISLKVAGAY